MLWKMHIVAYYFKIDPWLSACAYTKNTFMFNSTLMPLSLCNGECLVRANKLHNFFQVDMFLSCLPFGDTMCRNLSNILVIDTKKVCPFSFLWYSHSFCFLVLVFLSLSLSSPSCPGIHDSSYKSELITIIIRSRTYVYIYLLNDLI